MVAALSDIHTLISALGPADQLIQIPLADAAKAAGVSRFLPCAAITVIPAGGIQHMRDQKEQVYNHIKKIYLPYTIVDVGWWYQIAFPRLPSGKIDYAVMLPNIHIAGDGNTQSALTDVRDIGPYVARIVADERTSNKYVLVYNELWTQNAIWDTLSRLSGEEVPKTYESAEFIEEQIAKLSGTGDIKLHGYEYKRSWGIRGDNTPEYAKFLGYLTSKELYPDFEFVGFEEYLKEVLAGSTHEIYPVRRAELLKQLAEKK